jgi:hypothetical protein
LRQEELFLSPVHAKTQSAVFPNKMEMTMRKKTLTALVVALISALTVQAAAASEHHHSRAKSRAAAWAQMRNSNAYAAPGPAGSDFKAEQSYFTNMGNGYSAGGY